MTPEQFQHYGAQARRLWAQQMGHGQIVSLDAIFVAVVTLDAASARQAPAKATRRAARTPAPVIINDDVRETLAALQGQRLRLSVIVMQCGLLPSSDAKNRQFAAELRAMGFKSTRSGGEVVFDLTPPTG